MNKFMYLTIYVAIWITVANVVLSALQYSIKEMEGIPVAVKSSSHSRVAEMRDSALPPAGIESYDADQ